jgi:hypothetical protein
MNPRISSYADIEGQEGEAQPTAPEKPSEEHEGGGVALPTYRERHPHRGAERVDLGEPVADVMDGRIIPVVPPDASSPPAPTGEPTKK